MEYLITILIFYLPYLLPAIGVLCTLIGGILFYSSFRDAEKQNSSTTFTVGLVSMTLGISITIVEVCHMLGVNI